jgi:hypothetical protein
MPTAALVPGVMVRDAQGAALPLQALNRNFANLSERLCGCELLVLGRPHYLRNLGELTFAYHR